MIRRVLAFVASGALAVIGAAQSEQELRDTEAMVFRAFPEADSMRRIIRDVGREARAELEQALPFRVHFDELGPHTLFVASRGRRPVGLFYLRTEEAAWGFTEIGWALDLELRVQGFAFRRGRNQHMRELERSGFAKSLIGRDAARIRELLAPPAGKPPTLEGVPAGAEELAQTCLRSAMKALLVTELVWREEVEKVADWAMGFDAFPAAERFRREVVPFDETTAASRSLRAARIMFAYGTGRSDLGGVVKTDVQVGDRQFSLCWVVDSQLRVLRVAPTQSWADDELRSACSTFEGRRLDGPALVGNALQPAATELAAVFRRLAEARKTR